MPATRRRCPFKIDTVGRHRCPLTAFQGAVFHGRGCDLLLALLHRLLRAALGHARVDLGHRRLVSQLRPGGLGLLIGADGRADGAYPDLMRSGAERAMLEG